MGGIIYKQVFFCCLFCLTCIASSNGQNFTFNHLSIEDGLLSNSVLAIGQDKTGFIWLGTQVGLSRYDGSRFKTYRTNNQDSNTLTNNNIHAIFCDSKNVLWIGNSAGLDKYNVQKDTFERITLSGIRFGGVNCIYEDQQGNIWVGSSNGLCLLNGGTSKNFQLFYADSTKESIAGNIVRAIQEDGDGNLWLGTNNGLTKMWKTKDGYHFKNFRQNPTKAGSIHANYITSIAKDKKNGLWIGTLHDGVSLYNTSTDVFTPFIYTGKHSGSIINNNIRKILCTQKGKIWVGTQEGLSIIDPENKSFQSFRYESGNRKSLSQNSIYSLLEDANGSVWIGTYFGGANITYSFSTPFSIIQNNEKEASLSNNVVSSMVEDAQQNLWIGTEGGGLNYYNQSSGLFKSYKNKVNDHSSLGSNLVKVVYLDSDGNTWVGTHGGGLNVFSKKEKIFKKYLNETNNPGSLVLEITAMVEDGLGRFWVATNSGLKVFKRNNTDLQPLELLPELKSLLGFQAKTFFVDSKNNLWIGGISGLFLVSGNNVQVVDSNYYTNCIYEDGKSNIWLGFNFRGIGSYDYKKKSLITFPKEPGISGFNIIGILDDREGNLWLSSNNGLIKFDPTTHKYQTYTVSDGLAGNEFNYNSYLKNSKGVLFFGGFNGITHFSPSDIEYNKQLAPLVFTGLKLFNKNIGQTDGETLLHQNIGTTNHLVFKHYQDVFTIEFALLNFIKSNKNKYAYKLEGFDMEWIETSNPFATYTNLPSGKYTFWIKGANNDGVWSKPVSMGIEMLPPFWLTWWAYAIYFISLAAILFLVIRYFFLQALIKKEDELHQVKLNFFTNVSHEIRTHLTLIMAPVERLMGEKEKESFGHQQLIQVKSNADRLLKLVSELMDFRKAETNHLKLHVARYNLIPFLQEIYFAFRERAIARQINLSFIHNVEEMPVYFDKEQLEKVFFNLLANSLKFTADGGSIELMAAQKDNQVKVTVTDNGHGISPEFIDKLFTNYFQVYDHGLQNTGYGIGLALSKSIVELHKGTIGVESIPAVKGKGGKTVFTVLLDQGNIHFANATTLAQPAILDEKLLSQKAPIEIGESVKPMQEFDTDNTFTILVVEDNSELRLLIKDTFKNQYQILESENGLKGWEAAIKYIPDVIISDVMMPVMDGFELCSKLKTDKRTSHIPVILLTAKSSQNDQISGLETGADLYITKPFSTKILKLNLRNLLAAHQKMQQKFSQQLIVPATQIEDSVFAEPSNFISALDQGFLQKMILLIYENIDDADFGVEMLSKKMAMSVPVLYRKLKALTNMSVNEFAKSLKLKRAAELLLQKQMTVYEISYAVGYNDWKYFGKEFKKQYGKTPSEFAGEGVWPT